MSPFDNLRTNPILDQYHADPSGVQEVIDDQYNAMYWTDALLTASQYGWKDLLVALLEKLPADTFKGAALQTALVYNQNAVIELLLPQTTWTSTHTTASFSVIRAKNTTMFKKLLPRLSSDQIKEATGTSLNMFEYCVNTKWSKGVELIFAENDRREYEGQEGCLDLHQSEDFGLREAYDNADFDILKLVAKRIRLSENKIHDIIDHAPSHLVLDVLNVFGVEPTQWRTVLDAAVSTDEIWNWELIKEALRHTTPTDRTNERFLRRVCKMGDYATYMLLENMFSTTEVTEDHIEKAASSGNKDLMIKLLATYSKNLPDNIAELAATSGSLEMVKLFANKQNIRSHHHDILIAAVEGGNVEVLKHLLPFGNSYGNNSRPLFTAVCNNAQEMVDVLLPISHPAAQQGELLEACVANGNMQMFEQLLPYCNPNDDDCSALRRACSDGKMDFIERLLPLSDIRVFDYRAITEAVNNEHIDVLRYVLRLPQVQEDLDNVRNCVHQNCISSTYHLFTDCVAEIERETIQQSMDATQDSSLKRRRM